MSNSAFKNFKFPIAGWIILIHETLERFSFYGMKAILTIYLNLYLRFNNDLSTIIYHLFVSLTYLSPIIGAFIADNYLGRFKTVIVIGMVYLFGHILMPLTAIRKNIPGPLIGMCVLALGAGGIKSSVAAFGGDQIPYGNDKMVEKYFSLFYTAINLGAFAAQFVTPILRKDVSCVDNQCYPLAFGVPAATFLLTYIIFIAGTKTYNIVPRSKSVLFKVLHCIYTGISKCSKTKKNENYNSFLDYSNPEYSLEFIADCKKALRIIIVFAPIPVFWALYDQQGSRWTLQAKYMNGKIGSNYIMKPEQIQAFNSLLIIALIPVFDFIIYPFCEKFNFLVKPTSRLVASYVVAAISFILTAILQFLLVKGQNIHFNELGSKIVLINTVKTCELNLIIGTKNLTLNSKDRYILEIEPGIHNFLLHCNGLENQWKNLTLFKHKMKSVIVYFNKNSRKLDAETNDVASPDESIHIRFLGFHENSTMTLRQDMKNFTIGKKYSIIDPGFYDLLLGDISKRIEITPGLVGSITIDSENQFILFKEFDPDLIHMLWQMPQYILITCAEILCSITALSFAYSESPDSMKSLMQAAYLSTIFGGNLIVVIVAGIGNQITQTIEFILFSILVLIAGLINWILIRKFWVSKTDETKVSPMDEM